MFGSFTMVYCTVGFYWMLCPVFAYLYIYTCQICCAELLIVKVSLSGADTPVDSFKVLAELWTFKEQVYLKSEPSVTCT